MITLDEAKEKKQVLEALLNGFKTAKEQGEGWNRQLVERTETEYIFLIDQLRDLKDHTTRREALDYFTKYLHWKQ